MTKAEARAYLRRWTLVREFEVQELRATPMDVKLRQVESLMGCRELFRPERSAARDRESRMVLNRWRALRKATSE